MMHRNRFTVATSDSNCDTRWHTLAALSGPLTFFTGLLTSVLIPFIHIGIIHKLIWVPDKPAVNKDTCTCSCFDTVFKGAYENKGDSYKHLYFNATFQTLKIWTVTVFFLLLWYECIRRLLVICINRNIRVSMIVLFASNIYPMHYSWWSYFNYYNDDFYDQLYHQLFFTVTEFASVVMVLQSCDRRTALVPRKLLVMISVSLLHLILGSVDQFVENVLAGKGKRFQKSRDLGLIIPDLLHVILPTWELVQMAKLTPRTVPCSKKDVAASVIFITAGVVIGMSL